MLSERTNFVHGLAGTVSTNSISNGNDKISNLQIGIAYILGIQYIISDQFSISLENMPSISGVMNKQRDSDTQVGYYIGFYNNIANITLVHRFDISKRRKTGSE